ncbi:type IV pilin protein [Psychromonas ingrahamii]|nr:type IV pilin protein [Psychromonas ingrahamii]
MKKNKGFTLIELLIVIAIIGILTAIVVPSYQEHIRTANRTAAQLALTKIAQEFERTSARQGGYPTALTVPTDTAVIAAVDSPDVYTITPSPVPSERSSSTFKLFATPITGFVNDGDECGEMTIDQAGATTPADCWN